jgi:putative sigma-54 modulation protein
MKYQIIGKNITVTDAISFACQKKLARMDRYFLINDEVNCRVVVSATKDVQKVEVTIFLSHLTLRAEVKDTDLYSAIDKAIDKLEGQMRKLKTRMDRSNNKVSLGRNFDFDTIEDEEIKEDDIIVRTKSIHLEPMSLEEAITRMEALGHDFFMYLDKDDERISVCYVRDSGGYGVIEAENLIK